MADSYEVTGQLDTVSMAGGSRFEDVVEVSIRTKPNGIVKRVTIPANRYGDTAYVAAQLEAAAAQAEAVHQL